MKNDIRPRYLRSHVSRDLGERMVFVSGPRRVGKTTFALGFLSDPTAKNPAYMNWDDNRARAMLLDGRLPPGKGTIVLDEVHKFSRWRNLVKGFFDTMHPDRSFIVTGSARLDFYRKGGDSLQGRYHHYRLHPFTLPELGRGAGAEEARLLMRFGGFPEPLLKGEDRFWRRWQRERMQRVVYDDLRDLERVREISLLELLVRELPGRVGAPLSIARLAGLVQVSHETAERWIEIFERLCVCFRVPPLGGRRIRAVRKEQKLYMWDWSAVVGEGPRFENMVASHLLKYCHLAEDADGRDMELRYVRDTDGREVDFVVLGDGSPLFAVECKIGASPPDRPMRYFKERIGAPRFFLVHMGREDHVERGVRVLPFPAFCREIGIP